MSLSHFTLQTDYGVEPRLLVLQFSVSRYCWVLTTSDEVPEVCGQLFQVSESLIDSTMSGNLSDLLQGATGKWIDVLTKRFLAAVCPWSIIFDPDDLIPKTGCSPTEAVYGSEGALDMLFAYYVPQNEVGRSFVVHDGLASAKNFTASYINPTHYSTESFFGRDYKKCWIRFCTLDRGGVNRDICYLMRLSNAPRFIDAENEAQRKLTGRYAHNFTTAWDPTMTSDQAWHVYWPENIREPANGYRKRAVDLYNIIANTWRVAVADRHTTLPDLVFTSSRTNRTGENSGALDAYSLAAQDDDVAPRAARKAFLGTLLSVSKLYTEHALERCDHLMSDYSGYITLDGLNGNVDDLPSVDPASKYACDLAKFIQARQAADQPVVFPFRVTIKHRGEVETTHNYWQASSTIKPGTDYSTGGGSISKNATSAKEKQAALEWYSDVLHGFREDFEPIVDTASQTSGININGAPDFAVNDQNGAHWRLIGHPGVLATAEFTYGACSRKSTVHNISCTCYNRCPPIAKFVVADVWDSKTRQALIKAPGTNDRGAYKEAIHVWEVV